MCGDSAGGNLAVSVSLLATARGFRTPDALVPLFGVFASDISTFTPSILLSIDEELLSQHVINLFV